MILAPEIIGLCIAESKVAHYYAALYFLQTGSILIYILQRKPEDCFHCFNRLKSIQYSIYSGNLPTRTNLSTQAAEDDPDDSKLLIAAFAGH